MSDLEAIYRRYLAQCNERKFDELGEFLHDQLQLNGKAISRASFVDRLRSLIDAVPDFRWDLIDLVSSGCKLAVRNRTSGTPRAQWLGVEPNGNSVAVTELVFYTYKDGKIAEIWVLFDLAAICTQLS